MATHPTSQVIQQLRRVLPQEEAGLTDGQLLGCFLEGRDEAAFAALVKRHGPLVWGVCRRLLSAHDADDAFQATFLVLCRKAASIRRKESLAPWLYGVAHQTALQARRTAARRKAREKQVENMPEPVAAEQDLGNDLRPVLDQELSRLPEIYQAVILLCDLEGKSRREAAQQLGLAEGTVASRLARARALLARRLARHGLAVTGAALATALSPLAASAAVPASVLSRAIEAAAGGVMSSTVAALTEGVLKALLLARLKQMVIVGIAVSLLTLGSVLGCRVLSTPATAAVPRAAGTDPPDARNTSVVDRLGDPLPRGARTRLGTLRFRHGNKVAALAFAPDGKRIAAGEWFGGVTLWETATGKKVWQRQVNLERYGRMAFSPDGKLLAVMEVVGEDHSDRGISLFDSDSGKVLHRWRVSDYGDCSFAFSHDNKVLAIADWEPASKGDKDDLPLPDPGHRSFVRLCDVATGKDRRRIHSIGQTIYYLAFTPDDRALVFGDIESRHFEGDASRNYLRIWDLSTGRETRRIDVGHAVLPVAFSSDGKILAALEAQAVPHLWDPASGRELGKLARPEGTIHALAFGSGGKTLVGLEVQMAARRPQTIPRLLAVCWDVASGRVLWRTPIRMDAPYGMGHSSLAISPDGKTVAVADHQVHLLDAATGKEIPPSWGSIPFVNTVALSPDGCQAATGSPDGAVRFWETASGRELRRCDGHDEDVLHTAFSPRGTKLVSLGLDRTVCLWDSTLARKPERLTVPDQLPFSASFSCDGKARTVWESFSQLWVGEVPSGEKRELVCDLPPSPQNLTPSPSHVVYQAALSPDGHMLASQMGNGTVCLWGLASRKVVHRIRGSDEQQPGLYNFPLAFSPDGKTLVFRNDRLGVRLWEVATGKERCRLRGAPKDTSAFAFSLDGLRVASGDERGGLRLWDATTGIELWRGQGHRGVVQSLSFSARGHLASAGTEGTVLIWDVQKLAPVVRPIARRLTEPERSKWWKDLADSDATRAYQAIHVLRQGDAEVISWLGERLRPQQVPATSERIARLVEDLDSGRFAVRQEAYRELERLGAWAEPYLRRRLQQGPSLELRQRGHELLRKMDRRADEPGADELQALRAIEVLEGAGTAEARATLAALVGKGMSSPRTLREARLALQRLEKR